MVYKAIVEARPPGLDFILAATQVRFFMVEILIDSIHCRAVFQTNLIRVMLSVHH